MVQIQNLLNKKSPAAESIYIKHLRQ